MTRLTSLSRPGALLLIVFFGLVLTTRSVKVSVTTSEIGFEASLPSPPRPTLPDSWFDPNVTLVSDYYPIMGPIWYDGVLNYYKQEFVVGLLGFHTNNTIILKDSGSAFIVDDVCRNISAGLPGSFWSWIPEATYNGEVFVDGRGPCDEWIFKTSKGVLIIDVIDGTVPVRFVSLGEPPITGANSTFLFSPSFTGLTYNPEEVSMIFGFPSECFSMEVCPSGPVMNETRYLFHGANDFTLVNTNVADQLGDVAFVCLALILQDFGSFSWVSEYTLTVNTTYGQYGMCNYGTCIGGASDRVGQEAAEGALPGGGQCLSNDNLGNWFSLPSYDSSLCPGGGLGDTIYNETIGINGTVWSGCGWKVAEKVKTINGECIESYGFKNACIADNGYPWASATAIWVQAFSSDDPSNGGCPPIINATAAMFDGDSQLVDNHALDSPSLIRDRYIELIEGLISTLDYKKEE